MSDLGMQAAERIAPHCGHKSVGEVQRMIEADGVLVSHDRAALLREVERVLFAAPNPDGSQDRFDIFPNADGTFCVMRNGIPIESGRDPAIALKSALAAAGVPDSAAAMAAMKHGE